MAADLLQFVAPSRIGGAGAASEKIKRYGGHLVIPALGRRDLLSHIPLTIPAGSPPLNRVGPAGKSFYHAAAAANNGYRFGAAPSLNRSTIVVILRADAAPGAATFSGIGAQYFGVSWDHIDASFRGAIQWRQFTEGYTTATLGTLTANQLHCVAGHYDNGTLSAINNGIVTAQRGVDGNIFSSTEQIGFNQIAAQGYTFGGDVFAIWACNERVPLTLLEEITTSPAAFFNFAVAPRRIWVPVTAAPTGSTVTALLRQRSQFIGSGLR